jgi:hypothetical protein
MLSILARYRPCYILMQSRSRSKASPTLCNRAWHQVHPAVLIDLVDFRSGCVCTLVMYIVGFWCWHATPYPHLFGAVSSGVFMLQPGLTQQCIFVSLRGVSSRPFGFCGTLYSIATEERYFSIFQVGNRVEPSVGFVLPS